MKMLLRSLHIVLGVLGAARRAFGMPALNHMSIGSRCGGCRYEGPFVGESDD
ncbi:MAG: hypothetical protein AB1778_02670 [Candidatus Bipolaricaulota bacterium]